MEYTNLVGKSCITFEDVTLRVGDKLSFAHTNWVIQADQHWAIIGPNGAGKSLLVSALCREVPIVHGQIVYFFEPNIGNGYKARSYLNRGEVVKISPETLREFMQKYSGYHQARWQSIEGKDVPTVSDLLTGKSLEHSSPYEVTPLKVSEEVYHARRQHAITLLGIEYLLQRKILHVSYGESRKVLIARALMQSPKLLILDDPFCGLDTAAREVLKNAIAEVLTIGTPQIVLVTPRVEEIPQGITHILCVADNRVIDQGPKTHILQTDFARQIFTPQRDPLPLQIPVIAKREFPSPTLIEMKNTSVSYGGVEVLRDITWTMKPGEHWSILGPNGAGKTTLLSLILADNPQAYANDLTLFGIRRGSGESIWDIKQYIGWVSPELQMYYHSKISCHQVVCSGFFDSVGLYQACSSDQEQIATQWMRALGIEALADHPFSTLSAGEQRLVLLARALVKNPRLLVLDEPCQGLDGSHRLHILALLDQLCLQAPVSLLYVTHHVDEMPAAITHVLRLEHGRIRDIGTRQRVLGG